MNANGLYNGLDAVAAMGVYNGTNRGVGNGAVSNETNQLNIPLLDRFSGAAAAYSLRKLSANYSGPAIRVRRSSDNAEQDIRFNNDGKLNESSLIAFSLGGDVFVTIWYDQSGNTGRNAIQSTIANQPRIISSGVLEKDGNNIALFFDGTNDNLSLNSEITYTSNDQFISLVASTTSAVNENTAGMVIVSGSSGGVGNCFIIFGISTVSINNERVSWLIPTPYGYAETTTNFSGRNLHILQWYSNIVEYKRNLNLFSLSTVSGGGFLQSTRVPNLFRAIGYNANSNTGYFNGKIQEVVIWGTNQNGNTSSIQSNINSYYKIY